jgi:hypothetical protein
MTYKILSKDEYEKLLSLRNSELDSIYHLGDKEQIAETYKKDVDFLLYAINRLEFQLDNLRKICEVNKQFINFDVISFKEELNDLLSRYYLSSSEE